MLLSGSEYRFLGVVVALPFVSATSISVLGIPLLFFWVFMWFPLTSICLACSWYFFDRRDYPDMGDAS